VAQKPSRAVIPLREKPPHHEFLDRAKGTLPEIISVADLDTLNSALSFLFTFLRKARRQYDEEGDNGRSGAFTALAAYWMFVVIFRVPLAESLEVPILLLQDALAGLESNRVSPILKPIKRRGRSPSSYAHATLKGHVAGTVRRLMETGLKREEAYKKIAKRLNLLGARPDRGSGRVTVATVKNWCDEVSSDVGRHGTAALMYDSMFERLEEQERLSRTPKDQARDHFLDALAGWVQTVFPELRKPT